ncbi:MAG TPA: DUF4082 domain-containing protein, partial [Anaerolinea sp.]|nr:DUF4082 domain-containing protein [Anaerolinea sp.]
MSASWAVPADAVSGIYIAKLTRLDTLGASHITFIVRDDDGRSDLLFQTSDTTWQAYNGYGGYSLYAAPNHAHKVSYNRPFSTRTNSVEDFLFNSEYPMIRWLERNGYDVSYSTDVDTDRRGSELLEHKVFMSVGHDEYWSAGQRTAVEAARAAGVHLAFFSGNEIYWKTRWESSSYSGTPPNYRTLVSYKEGSLATGSGEHYDCVGKYDCDPDPAVWTGLWRDGCGVANHDGCKPENALSGNISWMGTTTTIQVPSNEGDMRFWRNTSIASATGMTDLTTNTLGYEWDFEQYPDYYPNGRFWLSTTNSEGKTHHLSLYKAASGALVFGAGTVQWPWGLDGNHDRGSSAEDPNMQQATVNLFADMGVPPATLQAGLVLASPSSDTTKPVSTIASPTDGSTINGLVTVTGTAYDDTGGVVSAVEVSVDGGATWKAASGRANWTFSWLPTAYGSVIIKSRAVDDSGNIGDPSSGISITVGPRACPCSIWEGTGTPAMLDEYDGQSIEVGVKFQASVAGYITALRFYKDVNNTGTHIGHLWNSAKEQLAEAVFSGESASGWQEVTLVPAVAVTANTTYVASYFSTGHYSSTVGYFTTSPDNPPVRARANTQDSLNGVYKYGASGFP